MPSSLVRCWHLPCNDCNVPCLLHFDVNRADTIHSALYAHKINTLFWQDVHDAEPFGFAKGQVTPFPIKTPDGQTLYAWHVLPVNTYIRNAESLSATERPQGPVADFTKTLPFELLSSTSTPAGVVINCELFLNRTILNDITNSATAKKSTATPVMSLKAGEQTPTAISPCNPTPT